MATKTQIYATPTDGAVQHQLANENAEYYSRTLLEALKDKVRIMNYGKKAPIPKNSGATMSMRRFELPSNVSTAIVEGITPDGINLTINKVTATVAQYGAWTKVSDYIQETGLDPIVTEITKLFGTSAGLSMEAIVAGVLNTGTNRQFAGGRANRGALATGDVMTTAEILKMRKTLASDFVPQIKLPNGKMGWLAFTHPTVINQIMGLTEWKNMNTYVDVALQQEGIVGQMYGIYFMEAPVVPTFTNAGSGTNLAGCVTLVVGADAFAIADVSGSSKPEIIVNTKSDTSNPMGLYSTIAWKVLFTSFILNQKCVLCLETLNA